MPLLLFTDRSVADGVVGVLGGNGGGTGGFLVLLFSSVRETGRSATVLNIADEFLLLIPELVL